MKRCVLTFVVFALIGSVINVAVAWVCALWAPGGGQGGTTVTGAPDAMQYWYAANKPWSLDKSYTGVIEETSAEYVGLGWRQQRLWEPSMNVPQGPVPIGFWRRPQVASAFRTYCGWPLYCLYGEQWTRYVDGSEQYETIYRYASALSIEKGMVARESARILPLRPIWLGFVINTVFFGGILWLATCGPFVLRRVIRRRRGRCAGCGYPVGSSAVCTECGHASPVR